MISTGAKTVHAQQRFHVQKYPILLSFLTKNNVSSWVPACRADESWY